MNGKRKRGRINSKSFCITPPFIVRLAKIVKKKFGKNPKRRNKILFKVNSRFIKKWSWNCAKDIYRENAEKRLQKMAVLAQELKKLAELGRHNSVSSSSFLHKPRNNVVRGVVKGR